MIKKLFKILGIIFLILIGVILFNTFMYSSKQVKIDPVNPISINDSCIHHLAKAVKFPTISYDDPEKFDPEPMENFIKYLEATYPLCDSLLEKEVINKYSLLYKWKGKDASLKPAILMGHMDVVPAEHDGEEKWEFEPFSGKIADGYIYGRGSCDDKVNVIGILEAVEMLLKDGHQPQRTIYLAFGHDEEIGGEDGAKKIAEHLWSKNITAEFALDEGLVVTQGIVPGIEPDVAMIGIAEKGYLSVELTVELPGGHSSMPAKETPIGILSNAIAKLEKNKMRQRICEPVQHFLDNVGPEMPFISKMAFANQWLFKSVVISKYEASNSGSATVRTTTAPTIFNSGVKDNVLPPIATATINFRILPGETSDDVLKHVEKTINDERIAINISGHFNEPSPVSDINSLGYKLIEKSIKQVYKNTLTAPSLMIGATDQKHYTKVTKNLFRFTPFTATSDDLKMIHGINEKLGTENFKNSVRFYRQLILNCSQK